MESRREPGTSGKIRILLKRLDAAAIVGITFGVVAAVLFQRYITTGSSGFEVLAWIVLTVIIFWATSKWDRRDGK